MHESLLPRSTRPSRAFGGISVGLDVGGTKVLGVALGSDGKVLSQELRPVRQGPREIVTLICDMTNSLAREAGAKASDVTSVGVGIPGVIDRERGTVSHAVNLGITEAFALAHVVGAALDGVDVRVENDLNVAAVGAIETAHPTLRDLAYFALGTGVAAGLVLDGKLRRGVSGAAGEIGHVPMVPGGEPCPCGQRGCLEVYAAGTALDRAWPTRTGVPAPMALTAAAQSGNHTAMEIWHRYTRAVAWGVQLLVLTYDVSQVVLGGGVAQLGDVLLDGVREALAEASESAAFLRSLDLADRVSLAPAGVPVAAVGAAVVGRGKV